MALLPAAPSAGGESVLDAVSAEVHRIYEQSKNCVVRIKSEGGADAALQVGTGFFIAPGGKLVSTASVASHARRLWIEWEGRAWPVKMIGRDERANVGLFQVLPQEGRTATFPSLKFGDARKLEIGNLVIAMGSPFDQPPSPTFGVVDGFDLPPDARRCVVPHIRTDLALNPGEGGGPLLNSQGEVVGLLVACVEQARTSYALPSHAIQRLIADFEQFGEARYGWIGLSVRECAADEDAEKERGKTCVKVQQVFTNTPAFRAGLAAGDKILQLGGVPIARLSDMLDATFAARVGDKLTVVVQRQALVTNFLVEVVARPAGKAGLRSAPPPATR